MLKFSHKIWLFSIAPFLLAADLSAQITAPAANFVKHISYKSYTGNDSLFVFYEQPGQQVNGSLVATGPGAGSYTFEWSEYDSLSASYGSVFQTDNNTTQSTASNLGGGGYKVRIYNGAGTDTSFLAWVLIDDLRTSIEKTPSGNVLPYKYTCDFLVMSGSVRPDTFYIYDPVTQQPIQTANGFTFLWTSDNPDLIIPMADRVLDPNTTYRPPTKDTWYFLTAIDSFGMSVKDSVFYESIQVKSDFSFMFFDKADTKEFVDPPSPPEDDAPLLVKFTNKSENGWSFEWIFADTVKSDFFANEFTDNFDYEPEYTYYEPGDYYAALVATSEEGCIDTFRLEEPITVSPSDLEVPNVFSPNGDDINDYFTVKFKSIKQFTLRIYSRSGNLVYKADIDDLYSWDGWDGTIRDSDRKASPGPYYYIIEATGYDNVKYRRGIYRGVVYLFR